MDKQKLGYALQRTWEVIGGDFLECGRCGSLPRDAVIEVVLDANYLEMYGNAKEDVAEFRKMSYDEQDEFAKTVFTYRSYGY
jgi:hypothetical protein